MIIPEKAGNTCLKCLLKYLLALSLFIQPLQLWSAQNTPEDQQQQAQQKELESTLTENTKQWTSDKEAMLPFLFSLLQKLEAEEERIRQSRGPEYLQSMLDANQLMYIDENTKAEATYRMIDGVKVPKVTFQNEAFLFLDENTLPRESKHLEQYIARVHFEAGKNGKTINLVAVNDHVGRVESLEKPKVTQWKWWKEYFISKYKSPTASDFSLALFTGLAMQGALTTVMSWMKFKTLGVEVSMLPTYFTMAYAMVIGTFYSTIKNWTMYSGSKVTRILKSQVVSALFAYGLILTVGSGDFSDRLATISIFTASGLSMNASILTNGLMNNFVKDFWNQVPRLRELTRVNAGQVDFKWKALNKILSWKKASVEGQLLYLIPWCINMMSLLTMASTNWLKIPGTDISVPLYQLASIPIAMFWSKSYANHLVKNASKDPDLKSWTEDLKKTAAELDNAWEKSFGMDVRDLPQNLYLGYKIVREKASTIAQKCIDFLKPE